MSTQTAERRRSSFVPRTKRSLRPDIQGLRAIAVLAVIADHLFHWPSGGFIGVDVFFVISGFLITGLLLREHDREGHISFIGFYRRRIKRILPASVLTLAVVAGASFLVFGLGRALQTLVDVAWAFAFSANWRFAVAGTDYFQADGPVSPVQHFWSLAVEEQFYFVWPWIMAAVLALAVFMTRTRTIGSRTAVGVVMWVIVAASFAWATIESTSSPTLAYFSTFTRAWELGAGALLAIGAISLARIPSWFRPILAWLGLGGIVASLFLITAESTFPAPWAALPVLSTVAVIAAGSGAKDHRFLFPITNRVAGYIGDISYSLYLWHFPAIIFLGVLLGDGPIFYAAALAAMTALAILSYHAVEKPLRESSWLVPLSEQEKAARRRARRHHVQKRTGSKKLQLVGLAGLLVATVVVVSMAWNREAAPSSFAATQQLQSAEDDSANETAPTQSAQEALSDDIAAAVATQDWPTLNPPIENLGDDARVPEWVDDGCLAREMNSLPDPIENASGCVYGNPDAENRAVVLGDSVAISWLPGIRAALGEDWSIQVLTMALCPAANVSVLKVDDSSYPECDSFREWSLDEVDRIQPDLTILSSRNGLISQLDSGASGSDAIQEWFEGTRESIERVSASSIRSIILASPPDGEDPRECVTAFGGPGDCVTGATNEYELVADAESRAVNSSEGAVQYVATKKWFCTTSNKCPAFVQRTTIRADSVHLTPEYSSLLSGVLAAVLKPSEE